MLRCKQTARRDDSFRAGPKSSHELRYTRTKRQGRCRPYRPSVTPLPPPSRATGDSARAGSAAMCSASRRPAPARPPSFVLPMLTLLEQGRARARMPRTLILEPTRELASQVQDSFARYGVNHKLNLALLIGGVSFDEQDKIITRGADVLIATPGRLLDHFERGRLLLSGVEILVIDETDRMLDMGFIPDIERIVKLLPFTRQTLFFSATMPPEISQLADRFLHNPVRVEVSQVRPRRLRRSTQRLVASGGRPDEKRATLRQLIDSADGPHQRDHLLQSQARRCDAPSLARAARLFGRRPARRHGPARAADDARQFPRRPASRFWSRATSRRAVSISRPSATSSISTCRPIRRTTSTASAAPAAPAAAARR